MDQQLKQRLIGMTIAVALVVIFVPMLFEKSDDKGRLSIAGIPEIPEDVLEKPLELPKTAEDLAPPETGKAEKAPAETGYRIVPLNEEPAPKPDSTSEKVTKPARDEKREESTGVVSEEDAQPETGKPAPKAVKATPPLETAKSPQVKAVKETPPRETVKPPQAKAPKPERAEAADKGLAEPNPALAPKKAKATTPKPVTVKPVESRQPTVKARPPVAPTEVERDMEDEPVPVPAPAKVEPPLAKSKSSAVVPQRPVGNAITTKEVSKKPETVKSAEPLRAAGKAGKTLSGPTAANAKPVRPAATKPAPQTDKPVKPADEETAKVQAKAPTAWVIQAGSFTEESAARGLVEKLKQSKFPAYMETIRGARGSIYKVQVGSEADRGRAEETLKQIEGSTGINGVITPHR